jgi:GNAT superfamily N-acetyltransferase
MIRGNDSLHLTFAVATSERLNDLDALFGSRGGCGGCWCMLWRLSPAEFRLGKGEGNRRGLHSLVTAGREPGILAYSADRPVGWCSVGPRAGFPGLARSRVLKQLDDAPVWSVTCLLVAKDLRRRGVSVALLRAAVAHARRRGASIVEGYPVIPKAGRMPDVFAWTGTATAFTRAGFVKAGHHSPNRPIMRYRTTKND